jgi:ribosomal protein L11 methyltransferase
LTRIQTRLKASSVLFFALARKCLDWLEISVTTDSEAAEAVVELFNRYSRGGTAVETPVDCFEYELPSAPPPSTVIVKAYLPLDGSADEPRRRLEEGLWHLGQIYPIPEPVIRTLAERDWAEAWKRQYHLQRVGQRVVIVPAWEEYEPAPGEVVISLEPGMAFGTGLHPTTRLCLQALEQQLTPGCNVLDVGAGSGILSIASAKLGADSVLALDADPTAVAVARENVGGNGVGRQVTVRHGTLPGGSAVPMHFMAGFTLELVASGSFDLIVINILAPVIISVAPDLAARLAPAGRVIAAGLIESQEQAVVDALRANGLLVVARSQEKDWVALVAQRRG